MNLHKDKELFKLMVMDATMYLGVEEMSIVEKDYFVTFFLQKIAEKQPDITLKGGTSLSKCHKLINRFSEDIDLSVDAEASKLTEGQRKRLRKDMQSVIDDAGFVLTNPEKIRSRRDFNQYVIDYGSIFKAPYLKPQLIVETSVFIKSFPTQAMNVTSLIYEFLIAKNSLDAIQEYGLQPFTMKVQTIERTFVDKTFAIADYYLKGRINACSRHIYDLYKLYPEIVFDDSFRQLVGDVREVRRAHDSCLSSKEGVDLPALLHGIVNDEFYKADYNLITEGLLSETLPYSEAITVIQRILDDRHFV